MGDLERHSNAHLTVQVREMERHKKQVTGLGY